MKKLRIALIGLLTLTSIWGLALPASAETAQQSVCESIGLTQGGGDCQTTGNGPSVGSLIATIVRLLAWVAGILGVVMMIIGSMRYITSGGDSNKVSNAKNTIMYALIGLAIAALSFVLVRFVLGSVS